ncbi:helix-turn-helix transcriptional regulator [Mechercharimyces sp. CAU 1602]|uniref:ArsR/SmtB family transcription factor n=1 Tax=Mechercharimyces sp. CAU 1602 TaxID=2973933 RepID=UPI0021620121|nr:metalloregulator ArsR/SmtB family transcription factor [Mechercharimyces sp. CAU 1602]MCS1352098.1 metalloregulator ArsR/SmtB family transcription factor [Mechercharimyces sp. CAU 1602]
MGKSHIDVNDFESITKFFTALGDPIRIQITFILGNNGKSNVTDIASHFDITRPSISHHLKILRDAQIVDSKKVGQEVYYWLSRERVSTNMQLIADALVSKECDV